jgi:hypothetical protein
MVIMSATVLGRTLVGRCRAADRRRSTAGLVVVFATFWASALLPPSRAHGQDGRATLRLVETLRIDGNAQDLVPINRVIIGTDGTIVLAQRIDNSVVFFGPAGERLGVVGRAGDGPGEFRVISGLGWIADTLWVLDGQLRRFTLISPAQSVIRTIPSPRFAHPPPSASGSLPDFNVIFPQALYADGAVAAILGAPTGARAEQFNQLQIETIGSVSLDGIFRRVIAQYPRGESEGLTGVYPFAPVRALTGFSADGNRIAMVKPSVEGPDAGLFRVLVVTPAGEVVYDRQHPFEKVPITRAAAEARIDLLAGRLAERRGAAAAAEYRRKAYVPPLYPPFTGIHVARDGGIWIQERATAVGHAYLVFDHRGTPLGRVILPTTQQVRAVERETVWVTEQDANGVESVVRYRVASRGG